MKKLESPRTLILVLSCAIYNQYVANTFFWPQKTYILVYVMLCSLLKSLNLKSEMDSNRHTFFNPL